MAKVQQQQTDMTPEEIADRVWELAKKIDFCMFTTWDGEHQQSRPLSARVERDEHAIYFLVSADSRKIEQIERYSTVNLAFADTGSMKFVSITGEAAVTNDRAKIADLWSDFDKAWWDDETDPDIRLLTVTPETAELWDLPGKAVAFAKMVAAAVTGAKPKIGENGTVAHLAPTLRQFHFPRAPHPLYSACGGKSKGTIMSLKHLVLAAVLAAPLAGAATLPATAATAEVRALSTAPVYRWHSRDSRAVGKIYKGETYTINYCTPPDQDWCRVVTDEFTGWVRGYQLGNGAKKAFVTPFRFGGGSFMMKPL